MQQHFFSILPLTATSLCCVCMHSRGAWVCNYCCYSHHGTYTCSSNILSGLESVGFSIFYPISAWYFSLGATFCASTVDELLKEQWNIFRRCKKVLPSPLLLLMKTHTLPSFKDQVLHRARYWSNGIL